MSRRVLFLNQYFPPDPAPTGVLLRELGDHLKGEGWETEYIASGQNYRRKKKGSRVIQEALALGAILWKGLTARRADVVFSASSPPCLLVVATLIALWHRARSVHWLMDMYPEIAVALGEIRDGALSKVIGLLMGWAYRRATLVVALDDDMAERLRAHRVTAKVMPPWVLEPMLKTREETPSRDDDERVWVYSGNLGRAHEWETLLAAQAEIERRGENWRLLFQGGGPSWPKAHARAEELGLRRCDWKPYVEENELRVSLARGDVLIVTQRLETQGLLWPSKLALVRDLARPILWVGPANGAIARDLRTLPDTGIFAPGDSGGIADWLCALKREPFRKNAGNPDAISVRAESVRRWAAWLDDAAA